MYFEKIKYLPYPISDKHVVLKDIVSNIRFKKDVIEDARVYAEYDIEDGETPEILAEKLYSDAHLYWVLMIFNQRYHYVHDFPMGSDVLLEYTQRKYGIGKEHEQHVLFGQPHFISREGYVVDGDYPGATPVTNYDYEMTENEKKRRIKIVDPGLIDQIVREAEELLNE